MTGVNWKALDVSVGLSALQAVVVYRMAAPTPFMESCATVMKWAGTAYLITRGLQLTVYRHDRRRPPKPPEPPGAA